MKLEYIRICLGTDGTARYLAKYEGEEDLHSKDLDPLDAIHEMTANRMPVELACTDPHDPVSRNYETLFNKPNGMTTSLFTLSRE